MSISEAFENFLDNLAVDNAASISLRYGEITSALNQKFRSTDSKTANSLQVGSYGRWTAIKGVSDLDMLYIMPARSWSDYNQSDNGQYRLLSDAAAAIRARYPTTTISVDRLVVRVLYKDFHVEAQPVFAQDDGSFLYPDSYNGGSWKNTDPISEIEAMSEANTTKNKNLRRLCKMARAWKNRHGLGMGGLLIDTLAHNFLDSTSDYDEKSFLYYDWMSRDFFNYLAGLPDNAWYAALGSRQRVKVKKRFQRKARKAHKLCEDAIAAESKPFRNDKWKKVYGRPFPARQETVAESITYDTASVSQTEQFIEDQFVVDVRHNIRLDCEVTQAGFRPGRLRDFISKHTPLFARKSLKFEVVDHDIPGDFSLFWKVLNRGSEAERRDCVRGQIIVDGGHLNKHETTSFRGDHIVECYAVKNGVVVATDRIHVPISSNEGEK